MRKENRFGIRGNIINIYMKFDELILLLEVFNEKIIGERGIPFLIKLLSKKKS